MVFAQNDGIVSVLLDHTREAIFCQNDPTLLAKRLEISQTIIICEKMGFTLTFVNVYHPLFRAYLTIFGKGSLVSSAEYTVAATEASGTDVRQCIH